MANLLEITSLACEVAKKEGAEWVQATASESLDISIELAKSSLEAASAADLQGLSIRAFVKGGLGSSSTSDLSEAACRRAAKEAAQMAKAAEPDPDFVALPSPEDVGEVKGLFDQKIAGLPSQELVRLAAGTLESAKSICPEVILSGGVGLHFTHSALANSAGVRRERKSTFFGASAFAVVKRGADVGSFYDFDYGRTLADVKLENLGAKATKRALTFLGARRVKTKRMALVLGPLASFSLLRSLAYFAGAENIQRRRSFMTDMRGKRIASEHLSLTDDGLIPRGLYSGACDGEGAPRRRVTLIDKGIFAHLLHNSYTANKAGEASTGHGTSGGGISATNLRPALGKPSEEEIIKDTEEGLYINMGALSPNLASGDVSASVDFGFKIENGRLAYPVINAMIGGHIFDLLKNIDTVSCDYREEPGNIMPTIRIQDVQVAGKG